jgi:hypothetical protein
MSHYVCSNFVLSFDKCKLYIFPQIQNYVKYIPTCDPNNITEGYTDKPYVIYYKYPNKIYEITPKKGNNPKDFDFFKDCFDRQKKDLKQELYDDYNIMYNDKINEIPLKFYNINYNKKENNICYVYIPEKYNDELIQNKYIRIYADSEYKGPHIGMVESLVGPGGYVLNDYEYLKRYPNVEKFEKFEEQYNIYKSIISYFILPFCIEQMKRLNINIIKIAGNFLNYPRTKAILDFYVKNKEYKEILKYFNDIFYDKYYEAAEEILNNLNNVEDTYYVAIIPSCKDNDIILTFCKTQEEVSKIFISEAIELKKYTNDIYRDDTYTDVYHRRFC